MKNLYRLMLLLTFVVITVASAWGQQNDLLKGRVINSKGEPIGYATIVAMVNNSQITGTTTDEKGMFTMTLAAGEYRLIVEFVGYKSIDQSVKVAGVTDLGDLTMAEASTEISEVVVSAQMIRREADRFVVDVANSDAAIGRNGEELLRQSPGVWIEDDKISVNGAGGTKIFINERELRLSGIDLVSYIRALKAEDIAKIEIIPQTGADHDANSAGGAIKITLRRRLENGVMGSVGITSNGGNYGHDYTPHARINATAGKFNLGGGISYQTGTHTFTSEEQTYYTASAANMKSSTVQDMMSKRPGLDFTAVYQINPKHSVGISYDLYGSSHDEPANSSTRFTQTGFERLSKSSFRATRENLYHNASFNYIFKTDSLGSVLKLLADYNNRTGNSANNYTTTIEQADILSDSLYKDNNNTFFQVATVSLARERKFAKGWMLKYGAKYTYNEVNSDAQFRYLLEQNWTPSIVDDQNISYTEDIVAAYAIASFHKGRLSAVMGLRGEYTSVQGKGADVNQNYLSLFPNANLSYVLDKQGKHSLVAQYSRTISRPAFGQLAPNRQQISDYTYQTGNPLLDPSYNNKIALTGVFAYRYSITLAAIIQTDAVQQIVVADPNDPRQLNLTFANLPKLNNYSATVSLPLNVTKWWSWNINLTGVLAEQKITDSSPIELNEYAQLYTAMNFKLPKNFFVDVTYWALTTVKVSNAVVKPMQSLEMTLKKRVKDNWTFTCSAVNLLTPYQDIIFKQKEFSRHIVASGFEPEFRVRLGAIWSFKSGKAFNTKQVEKAGDEDRM